MKYLGDPGPGIRWGCSMWRIVSLSLILVNEPSKFDIFRTGRDHRRVSKAHILCLSKKRTKVYTSVQGLSKEQVHWGKESGLV